MPLPLIKPESTGKGINLMYFPIFIKPKSTWNKPVNAKVKSMVVRAFSKLPNVAIVAEITVAETTVIGPVGPLTWVFVPPKRAAKNPRKIAPYKPAFTPNPDCTPKASARGNATTPAVKPPKRSPLKILMSNFFMNQCKQVIFAK